jgi:hypothetical protein
VNLEAALAPAPTPSAGPAPNAGAPPGSSPPSGAPPFHSALAEHWARTAQAEGQSKGDSDSGHHERGAADAGAQAGEAGLVAASLEAQSQVSGAAGKAAGKAAVKAAAQGARSGALPAGDGAAEAGAPGSVVAGARAELGSSAGDTLVGGEEGDPTGASQRVEAPLESTLQAGEPSGPNMPGGHPPLRSGGGRVEGIPVVGRARTGSAPSAGSLSGTNVLASGDGARGASAPASDEPTPAPAQALTPMPGTIVGVPSQAHVAPTAAAGQQQAGDARAVRLSADEGAAGIDVARSSKGSRLVPGPIGRGESPAKDVATGGAQGTAGLAAPGSIASELDSLLAPGSESEAPASSASATAVPVTAAGVGMQDMIDSIHATIELAARQGVAQARIALHPQELGHIAIRLSQTGEGLLARVSAETPAGAQALAEGRAELHQTLSSLGVTLLRLDVGSFTQSQTGERDQSASGQGGSSTSGEADGTEEAEGAQAPAQTTAPAGIGAGELVDVLA